MSKKVKTVIAKKTKAKAETKGKEFKSESGRKFVTSSKGVEFWNPQPNESVEGEFIEVMEFKGGKFSTEKDAKGNPIQKKCVIKTDDDKQIALPSHASVVKFMEDVKAGEFVHITYNGLVTKKGQEHKKKPEQFHSYTFAKELA